MLNEFIDLNMKKRIFLILIIFGLLVVTTLNVNSVFTPKKWDLLLENIEAIADITENIPSNACPNGGQYTKGDATNKRELYTIVADINGKVSFSGAELNMGASYSNQPVRVLACWVECPGSRGDCILCNIWLARVE